MPFTTVNGAPLLEARVGGQTARLLLDTAAWLSYAAPHLTAGLVAGPEAEDFMPGLGRFTTPTYRLDTTLNGTAHGYRFGHLPPVLRAMLERAGADGVLGNEVCQHYRVYLAFPRHEVRFKEYA